MKNLLLAVMLLCSVTVFINTGCVKDKKYPIKEKAQDIFIRAKVEAEIAKLDINTDSISWKFIKLKADSAELALEFANEFKAMVKAELNNPNAKKKKVTPKVYELSEYPKKVAIMSRSFVKPRLKNPKSADFPNSGFTVLKHQGNVYSIESYVDSKNAFNAEIRTKYRALIEYKGGDWSNINNWKLENLTFIE